MSEDISITFFYSTQKTWWKHIIYAFEKRYEQFSEYKNLYKSILLINLNNKNIEVLPGRLQNSNKSILTTHFNLG